MPSTDNHHRIDYIEFPTNNLARSRGFLEAVFGWEFTDYGPNYSSFKDGRLDGGLDQVDEPVSGGTFVVLYSSDLEETLSRVIAEGGVITKPIFKFPGGRRFQFIIPESQEAAVWSE